MTSPIRLIFLLGVASLLPGPTVTAAPAPLKIAYSDWPGWVAWDIATQNGWWQEAGLDVEFVWSSYTDSMTAFASGKVDGVMITNGDSLSTSASGAKNVIILLTDYSNGNDLVIASSRITSIAELKGRKIALEAGLVEHLLLIRALKEAGLTEKDVTIVNVSTDQTPEMLASRKVDAIAAWQPVAGKALKAASGAHVLFTSANEPGLIYDGLAVNPQSLNARRDEWVRLVAVWDKVIRHLRDRSTQEKCVALMSARSGTAPEEYSGYIAGTRFLTLEEGYQKFTARSAAGMGSFKVSSLVANDFNVKAAVYSAPQNVDVSFDASVVRDALVQRPLAQLDASASPSQR